MVAIHYLHYNHSKRPINILQALKRDLKYPRYVWIAFDWYPQRWWTLEVAKNHVDCMESQLADFIENMISLRRYPEPDNFDNITDAGIVSY